MVKQVIVGVALVLFGCIGGFVIGAGLMFFLVGRGNQSAGTENPIPILPQAESVPPQVLEKAKQLYSHSSMRNVQVELTGAGSILPNERNQGVDKLLCVKIRFEQQQWANTPFRPVVYSGFASRVGQEWRL